MTPFKEVFQTLGRYFVVGVVAVLPLVITVGVVVWVVGFLGDMLGPGTFLGERLGDLGENVFDREGALAYVLGWAIVLGVIFALGFFFEMGAKKYVQARVDGLIRKIPVMGGVYGTARQLADMMDSKSENDMKAMSVVYIAFGSETGAAFLALQPTPEKFRIGEIDYHAILIPTAPVPFGGSLLFVPAAQVKKADMSVDAFMSVYVSMGVTGPQFLDVAKK